jgi:nitrile hydratase subunit alpha
MPHDGHDFTEPPPDPALRIKALESLLIEKGLIDPDSLNVLIDTYEHKVGPRNGAQVVARAWVDEAFKEATKQDCSSVIKEAFGFEGRQGEHIVAVENTADIHNVVVCTLCSCYPWTVLGLPPVWYKSAPYRSRVVQDPRGVLHEFGTAVPDGKEIRVWDSTSEMRYLVIPERPEGTEGWSEEKLADLVTRNSMIGVELAKNPDEVNS